MEKSRNLSGEEFIKILQLEYFSHKVRSLIYEDKFFIKMHKDIAEKKKEKIKEISVKFSLPTIFNSTEDFLDFYQKEFIQEYGLPNFQYTLKNKDSMSHWDKFFLLKKGRKVIWEKKDYWIKSNNPEAEEVVIMKNGVPYSIPYIDLKIKLLYAISLELLR